MIHSVLTNDILKQIVNIEENRFNTDATVIPEVSRNKFRKLSKKKSSYASNKIEGNPLTEAQVDKAIDDDSHRHFMKPEQEVRNYYLALNFLEQKLQEKTEFSRDLILQVQALVEKGAPGEKIGFRGAMPPGFIFAVYDSETGEADYIPPEYSEVPELVDELVEYVNTTDDHPLIVAAIVHYQLVTIHGFEDGNGRTARLMSGYIMDYYGYGFGGIGSLEEYFAYDSEEYYSKLQMGLPALYYSGRDNPPHPEIWMSYFLRMVELYSTKVRQLSLEIRDEDIAGGLSHLSVRERDMLEYTIRNKLYEFTPIEVSKNIGVTNKTIINRCVALARNGYIIPVMINERIRSYRMSDYTIENSGQIVEVIERRRQKSGTNKKVTQTKK